MTIPRWLVLVLGLMALTSSAMADNREAAKEHFRKAQIQFNLGRYDAALPDFERAYEALPEPIFLYNIGQCLRLLARAKAGQVDELPLLVRARDSYKRFLGVLPDAPIPGQANTAASRTDVEKMIAQIDAQIGELRSREEWEPHGELDLELATAKLHYKKAKELSQAGDHYSAIAQFDAAYSQSKKSHLLFSIAAEYRILAMQEWKPAEAKEKRSTYGSRAIKYFRLYLEKRSDAPDRARVEAEIVKLQSSIGEEEKRDPASTTTATARPAKSRGWLWGVLAAIVVAAAGAGVGIGVGVAASGGGPPMPSTTLGSFPVPFALAVGF